MKIAIIGAGNMGAWLANELAGEHQIALYNRTKPKAEDAAARITGGKVRVLASLSELSPLAPDMLINAVSLQNTIPVFEEAARHVPKGCVLCDVASIKGDIPAYYAKSGFRFASVHPMFGPTFANVENLSDENAVIIKESDPQAAQFFRALFQKLKLHIYDYTFEEHDQMMAYSLAVPFSSTLVFAACMDRKAVPGTTFKRHMKIARGLLSEDDWLLSEILFNRYSLRELERITNRLEYLKHVIKGKDKDEMKKFLDNLRKNIA